MIQTDIHDVAQMSRGLNFLYSQKLAVRCARRYPLDEHHLGHPADHALQL